MINKTGLVLTSLFLTTCFGCNGGANASGPAGINGSSGTQANAPAASAPAAGTTCKSGDPNQYCLAVKYVVYKDDSGQPIMSKDDITKTLKGINDLWAQCKIGFQAEQVVDPMPKDLGLDLHTKNDSDLTQIRKAFQDSSTLLVVTTGSWDRSGSLGDTGANAWTSMPGEGTYGAVLESTVKTFSNIIAHELGHYLNLDHVSDTGDLMNPIIYDKSTQLTESQCSAAREAVQTYWQKMLR